MSLKTVCLGRHDILIIDTVDPESNKSRKSLQLLAQPIVLAVKVVIGDSFARGIIILGPK